MTHSTAEILNGLRSSVETMAADHITAMLASSPDPLPQYVEPAPYHVIVPQRKVI